VEDLGDAGNTGVPRPADIGSVALAHARNIQDRQPPAVIHS
jgi:hypothetical protein